MTAKFWAAEGGQRVVHAAQHLHGGIGMDLDYPIHRYFRWAKVLELTLGRSEPVVAPARAEPRDPTRRGSPRYARPTHRPRRTTAHAITQGDHLKQTRARALLLALLLIASAACARDDGDTAEEEEGGEAPAEDGGDGGERRRRVAHRGRLR